MAGRYWLETLGCPKNQVDSEKLAGLLEAEGFRSATGPERADLVVVNTCAFIEAAREESIGTVLQMASARKPGARLVITGCMAERYGSELAEALPEVDQVAGFGATFSSRSAPVKLVAKRRAPSFDLLNLPRPPTRGPWAYVKVAEGCDRKCGFCAIPSFRGRQRSRTSGAVLDEIDSLDVQEVVLVAQDLASWGRDAAGPKFGQGLVELLHAARQRVARVRLLYLYPSGLGEGLIEAIGASGCPYYDLSLQHVSRSLLRRMRRAGDGERFLAKIGAIRRDYPDAALRSSFIVGYPGETEEDHDALLAFLREAQLDWAGFFAFSREEGTYAAGLSGAVPSLLVADRLRECSEVQDAITAQRRLSLIGQRVRALVDRPGEARSHREAPEIDGVIQVPRELRVGAWVDLEVTEAAGPDLVAVPVAA
ncbi:MAG TPA: 30S ribosomal protein S12 methylthiotransferase RimO [Acidimicrobiales bacterium]|nr:30S ribosomal protein S12 methylthiotransferase RimO [Acidimicrobiales bacterium]